MKVSVFGLGYVGTVSAACLAKFGHEVIGVDVNRHKVDVINQGKSPIVEKGLEELVREMVGVKRLKATTDTFTAIQESDVSLVAVGTPSEPGGGLDLSYVYQVCAEIGETLGQKEDFHVIAIRSTVLPGTIDIVADLIGKKSQKVKGEDFGVCSNPEFLREGTAIADFYNPPYTVIGENDSKSGEILARLYERLEAPLYRVNVKVAEMIKYANNSFHAMKVAFANEIGAICKTEGIDSHKVMEIFCQDTKLNLSPYYLKPGFAFGGSCLPKDVRAIVKKARTEDLMVPLLESLLPSNEKHLNRALDRIIGYGKKKIGILGLSFKSDTDDLRESPTVELVERLLGKGYEIKVFDQNVAVSKLIGKNMAFIEQKIPHLSALIVDDLPALVDHAELIVIANPSKEFKDLPELVKDGQVIVDLVRLFPAWTIERGFYDGLCW